MAPEVQWDSTCKLWPGWGPGPRTCPWPAWLGREGSRRVDLTGVSPPLQTQHQRVQQAKDPQLQRKTLGPQIHRRILGPRSEKDAGPPNPEKELGPPDPKRRPDPLNSTKDTEAPAPEKGDGASAQPSTTSQGPEGEGGLQGEPAEGSAGQLAALPQETATAKADVKKARG